ncbi:MAG TPA: DUF4261 domain-containing protein [Chryseolinea sp.]|nr:DUF4261 domain-containing protein [Chryseolinea sp.]HPM29073.1 DUF4261 domain-containing protein [Chryseolinea sp.]
MSLPLPYIKRVEIFQKLVYAVSKSLNPIAIFFTTSEKIVPTTMYIKQIDQDGFTSPFGLINVRFFSINEDNTSFMDTVGLHTLGLPDFQIRYNKLNPTEVAGSLYAYAEYIYKNGSVILNGNTVEGIQADSKWECVYQGASLEPKRNVLQINIHKDQK